MEILDDPKYAKYRKRTRSEKSVMRCDGCGDWLWKPRWKKIGCQTCNTLYVAKAAEQERLRLQS